MPKKRYSHNVRPMVIKWLIYVEAQMVILTQLSLGYIRISGAKIQIKTKQKNSDDAVKIYIIF